MVDRRPLVICENDRPIDVVLVNEKGYRKSIETGQLWSLHPDTGRLLPYPEGASAQIEDNGTWYLARLSREGHGDTTAGNERLRTREPGAPDAASSRNDTTPTGSADIGTVLTELAALIHTRRLNMPEGSYTTHLFEQGSAKIRKKTGEEAVELVLASTPEELKSEAADLIYHLLVLLESEGISLDEIAGELSGR